MAVSRWIILLPLIIGMGMNLFVKNTKSACGNVDKMMDWTPPPYVFFIVWPILYLIIGFVYYQFLQNHSITSKYSLFMIAAFIALNLWNVIFRNVCLPLPSFIYIILITLVYYIMTYQLMKMKVKYAYLMIALVAWLTFASWLTYLGI